MISFKYSDPLMVWLAPKYLDIWGSTVTSIPQINTHDNVNLIFISYKIMVSFTLSGILSFDKSCWFNLKHFKRVTKTTYISQNMYKVIIILIQKLERFEEIGQHVVNGDFLCEGVTY